MATRSIIALALPRGAYRSIYCHWDGYPDVAGATLTAHYSEPAKVRALLALGDLSQLAPAIDPPPGVRHTFAAPAPGVCVAYWRDRGETGTEARDVESLPALMARADACGAEYVYIFNPRAKSWQTLRTDDRRARVAKPARAKPAPVQRAARALADVLAVIDTTDPTHPAWLDSGADSIDRLVELRPAIEGALRACIGAIVKGKP